MSGRFSKTRRKPRSRASVAERGAGVGDGGVARRVRQLRPGVVEQHVGLEGRAGLGRDEDEGVGEVEAADRGRVGRVADDRAAGAARPGRSPGTASSTAGPSEEPPMPSRMTVDWSMAAAQEASSLASSAISPGDVEPAEPVAPRRCRRARGWRRAPTRRDARRRRRASLTSSPPSAAALSVERLDQLVEGLGEASAPPRPRGCPTRRPGRSRPRRAWPASLRRRPGRRRRSGPRVPWSAKASMVAVGHRVDRVGADERCRRRGGRGRRGSWSRSRPTAAAGPAPPWPPAPPSGARRTLLAKCW